MAMLNNIFGGQPIPPTTNHTFTTSTGTGNLNVSGSSGGNIGYGGGGSGGNINPGISGTMWGISGQATPQFTNSQPINLHIKCKRCGYKDNEYSDKYCILCNEEIIL